MTTPIRFSLVAAVTSAFLSTSALIPASGIAAVSPEDAGVSMTVKPGLGEAPKLKMITRGDIQGESFFANPFEVIDLLLTDGTTLTMAAGTTMVVNRYAYDPGTRSGELATTLEQGTLRVIGGTLNNTQPITVATPAGLFYLDNAAVVIVVEADGSTRAVLEYGKSLTLITEDGEEIQIVRPGFEVRIAADGTVSGPVRRAEGDAIEIARLLNPGLVTDVPPAIGVEDGATNGEDDEEQTAQLPGDEEDDPVDPIEDDLTETEPETPEFDFGGGGGETDGGGGFEAGGVALPVNTIDTLPSQSNGQTLILLQNVREPLDAISQEVILDDTTSGDRPYGLATSKLYGQQDDFSVDFNEFSKQRRPEEARVFDDGEIFDDIQYVIDQGANLIIGIAPNESAGTNIASFTRGLFFVSNDPVTRSQEGIVTKDKFVVSDVFGGRASATEGGRGTLFGSSIYSLLQDGFRRRDELNILSIERDEDNFIVIDAKPVQSVADHLRGEFDLNSIEKDKSELQRFRERIIEFADRRFLNTQFINNLDDNQLMQIVQALFSDNFFADFQIISTQDVALSSDEFLPVFEQPFVVKRIRRDDLAEIYDVDQIVRDDDLLEQFWRDIGVFLNFDVNGEKRDLFVAVARAILGHESLDDVFDQVSNEIDVLFPTSSQKETLYFELSEATGSIVNPDSTSRFIFAAGDVDADPDTVRRLDIFYITPGLEGFDEDGNVPEGARVADSIRAFLRNATDLRDEEGNGGVRDR